MSICNVEDCTQRIEDKEPDWVIPDIKECQACKYNPGISYNVGNVKIYGNHLRDMRDLL
jgi:hypothetical protein